ncbi:hypothetical protein BDY24DRAFT_384636 [Mrakia frigida]|uniref:uncharacterized protein n=1 Tax=Mrakia frigida TaxID=29902 RepID=UPI003FCC1271
MKLTPCRFCLGLVVLVVGAFGSVVLWTMANLALVDLAKARNPHLAHHHPVNESMEEIGESNLVRSFYGEAKDGGVDHFDLIASIYHRVMVKNETEVVAGLELEGEEGALTVVSEEDKGLKKEEEERELVWGPWERIFSEVVLEGLTLKSKGVKTVAKITIPGRLLPSLRNSTTKVGLKASFAIYPSSLNTPGHLIPINSSYSFVHNASELRFDNLFPGPWPLIGNTLEEQNLVNQTKTWKRQLVRFATSQNLLREVIHPVEKKAETTGDGDGLDVTLVDETGKDEKAVKGKARAIISRSMVTMVQDSSVYALAPFRKQMEALGNSQRICNLLFAGKVGSYKLKGPIPDCKKLSTFAGRGHFESLFEMGTEEDAIELEEMEKTKKESGGVFEEEREEEERQMGAKGWRYGPYIQTNFGISGPADLLELGNGTSEVIDDDSDFSFDWHLTFSTTSPLKVALATGVSDDVNGQYLVSNRSTHNIAEGQDRAELFNAILGHPFNPSARPILRKFLRTLSSILTFFSVIIQAHFWITRSVTTGISMPAQVIDSVGEFIHSIWKDVLDGSRSDLWIGVIIMTVCSSVLWALALRLEFSWWGWVPIWVSRRKASHLERASARLDMRFSWKQRGLSFLVFLAISFLAPKLPYLIHASPPKPLTPSSDSIVYTDKSWYLRNLGSLNYASGLFLFVSQFLLNQRAKTFGANYRFVAAMDLLSSFVHILPVLLSSRWGRWELMDPWRVTDLLEIMMQAAYAWQAWNLPEVKQEEEEDE